MKRRLRRSDIALDSLYDPPTAQDGRFAERIPRWEETPVDVFNEQRIQITPRSGDLEVANGLPDRIRAAEYGRKVN